MKMRTLSLLILGFCLTTTSFANISLPASIEKKVTSLKSSHVLDLTDLINGQGYYSLAIKDPVTGVISYTRDGRFFQRDDGYYYQNNKRLQGFTMPLELLSNNCVLTDIRSPMGTLPGQASSMLMVQLNLNALDTYPSDPFNPVNVKSFNFTTPAAFYDKFGEVHSANLYYVKTNLDTWDVYLKIDDNNHEINKKSTLVFSRSGKIVDGCRFEATFTPKNSHLTQPITIDLCTATQLAAPYEAYPTLSDGYPIGEPEEDVVDANGYISLFYSNYQVVTFGKIAVYKWPA